jgi:hypothetical protein
MLGNYAARHRDSELAKEAEKNQQEILRLRQRLARAQLGYHAPDQLLIDSDDNNEMTNISIIKLA